MTDALFAPQTPGVRPASAHPGSRPPAVPSPAAGGTAIVVPSQTGGVSDVQRALDMVAALCVDTDSMWFTVIPGAPPSKSRPRFTRNGRAYTKPEDRVAETRTREHLRTLVPEPLTGNVALGCVFFRPDRQRIDADNMLKHVCDAANEVLYLDDSQVTAVLGVVELDAENPRTVVVLGEHTTTLTRGTDATKPCAHCGKPVSLIGRANPRKYCSPACTTAARGQGLADPVACQGCGEPFRRKAHTQKYCSQQCVHRTGPRPSRRKSNVCVDCSAPVSKAAYTRCRECWTAARGRGEA